MTMSFKSLLPHKRGTLQSPRREYSSYELFIFLILSINKTDIGLTTNVCFVIAKKQMSYYTYVKITYVLTYKKEGILFMNLSAQLKILSADDEIST